MMRMVYPRDQTMFGQTDGPHWASYQLVGISQVALVVKNLPAKAGDVRDAGLIPGSGRPPGEGNGNPLHILSWRILWTQEPGRFIGSQRVRRD